MRALTPGEAIEALIEPEDIQALFETLKHNDTTDIWAAKKAFEGFERVSAVSKYINIDDGFILLCNA